MANTFNAVQIFKNANGEFSCVFLGNNGTTVTLVCGSEAEAAAMAAMIDKTVKRTEVSEVAF